MNHCAAPARRTLKRTPPPTEIAWEKGATGDPMVMARRGETHLWLLFRGAPAGIAVAWTCWTTGAMILATLAADGLGPAGVVMPILLVGWLLARHLPSPLEAARRYHLDDLEVSALGPGRRVRRVPWSEVNGVTQERHALVLAHADGTLRLPLPEVRAAGAWGPALARVVPGVAAELWARTDAGPVRLSSRLDPPTRPLAWWAWAPALATCVVAAGLPGVGVALVAVSVERAVAWVASRLRGIVVDGSGITLLAPRGRTFVSWADALVAPCPGGLAIARPGHDPGMVPATLANFWAIAPVCELRAQLGPDCPSEVSFRARVEDGALAVVGEVEALH